MGDVAYGDVLRLVEDGVESLVRLHAEGGDGDEDEEQGAERHILQGKREKDELRERRSITSRCNQLNNKTD